METNKMKYILSFALLFLGSVSWSQFSLGGGISTLFQFGNNKPFGGMNIVLEIPRNNEVTFYVRANYLFKQQASESFEDVAFAKDPGTTPYQVYYTNTFTESFNYFMVDGGTRYYLINGYDEGFSLYGGSNIGFAVNSVKYGYSSELDTTKYQGAEYPSDRGSILNVFAGITGGLKYTFPGKGTLFFDVNPSLMLMGFPSSEGLQTSMYKQVVFNINVGYRKEFY